MKCYLSQTFAFQEQTWNKYTITAAVGTWNWKDTEEFLLVVTFETSGFLLVDNVNLAGNDLAGEVNQTDLVLQNDVEYLKSHRCSEE